MRIEIHVLQNFAPSNLNRDDTGSPKDAHFGGYRRARISSQCQKQTVRKYFNQHDLIPEANRAVRTTRLLAEAQRHLAKDGRDQAAIARAVTTALAAANLKLNDKKKEQTQYLLFLGKSEIASFFALVDKHFDLISKEPEKTAKQEGEGKKKTARQQKAAAKDAVPDEVLKAVPKLLDGGKAADLALFGRMLADLPEKNMDASCQVAHAISTNEIRSMEMDYYTAVDDINNDNSGADMIGTVEFNSACFYRYANLDVNQLIGGFREPEKKKPFGLQGDTELASKTADAFLQAFIQAIPTGKQNSFAAHNPPSLVFVTVRNGGPLSLANAFVEPARPDHAGNLVLNSVRKLDRYYGIFAPQYGDCIAAGMWSEFDDEEIWRADDKKKTNGKAEAPLKGFRKPTWNEVIATVIAKAFDGKEAK